MDPIEKAAAEEFDRWAEAGRGESMARGHSGVTQQILDRWSLQPHHRVLDVGCGNGWAVRAMLQRGAGEGVGVDVAPAMIERARLAGPGRFEVASGADLPFDDGEFSHLLSVESLYYYSDCAAAMREWARVAAKGAQLAVMVELYAENLGSLVWIDALDVHAHLYSTQDYARLAAEAGWRNVRTEQIQDPAPISGPEDFTPSPYFPDYALYVAYREAGALVIWGER